MLLAENLKRLRKNTGKTQEGLALEIGLNPKTYSNYEQGVAQPDAESLYKISRILGVTMENLLYGTDEGDKSILKSKPNATKKSINNDEAIILQVFEEATAGQSIKNNVIDLDSRAAAGIAQIINDVDRYKSAPTLCFPWIGNGFNIRVEIKGDSMYPTIKDGDKAIATLVSETDNLREGLIYLLLDKEEGLVCKRAYRNGDNALELVSDNEIYKPYKRSLSDILAIFRIREVHSTDFRPYMSDIRRDIVSLRASIEQINRRLDG